MSEQIPMTRSNWLILMFSAGALLWTSSAPAAEDEPKTTASAASQAASSADDAGKFMRIRRDADNQPIALETAVTRYVSKAGQQPAVQVDLIGAVHVGEHQYYEQLNDLFKTYDVVLYELVAPEGTRIQPGQPRGSNPVSALQMLMKNVLKLEFQLDQIDYTRPNLVHADMSPTQFTQSMKDRGESFVSMFLRLMLDSMAVQAKRGSQQSTSDIGLLVALIAKDRAFRLKKIMAEQFETMEEQMSSLSGPKGSTIITERNKKALEVLRTQIEQGKRHVAIFYGAGHLSDMEQRLINDFGLQKDSQRWLTAWSMTRETPAASEAAKH
jgi:hypothetical protein